MNYSSDAINNIFSYKNKMPNKVAVVDCGGKRKTSWIDFINFVNSISEYLIDRGVQKGDIVCIDIERCMEHTACRISCLAIGAVFLSLSEACPAERKSKIFNDCNPKICITKDELRKLEIKDRNNIINNDLTDKDLAFIVYTSGTLGIPKGVLHNRSVFENNYCFIKELDMLDFTGTYASLSDDMFIISFTDLIALFIGMEFHVIGDEYRQNPIKLKEYFDANKIAVTTIHPAILYYMGPVDCLRIAMVGSEQCSYNFDNHKTIIINSYGMSECPIIAFEFLNKSEGFNLTLGKSKIFLSEGELCYAGPGIMEGYINKELHSPIKDSVLHTGDLAIKAKDNSYVITGRKDSETKINGKRVNTSEVEHHLAKIDGVAECAVVKIDNKLVAFYSSKNLKALDLNNFNSLAKILPEYAIPSKFMFVRVFKRNQNGKIDRHELGSTHFEVDKAKYVAPKSNTEKDICKAFSKALNIKKVGVNDDFVSLGGGSLEAVALLANLKHYSVSFKDVIELRTPRKLAQAAEKSIIPKYDYRDKYPLANTSYYIYDLYRNLDYELVHDYPYYTISILFSVKHIKAKTLIKAFNKVLDNHPTLKSKIDGNYLVRRDDWYPQIDVKKLDFEPDKKFFNNSIKPIDYAKDDLFRAKAYTYKNTTYFLADINHIACDGYSGVILFKDLLSALLKKKLKPEKVSTFDYYLNLKESLEKDREHQFFKKIKNGDKATLLPRSGKNHTKLALFSWRSVLVNKEMVKEVCLSNNIPEQIYFMSICVFAIARSENLDEVNFIYLSNGRRYSYLENTVGCLYEFCPVFCKVEKNDDILDVAKRIINICRNNTRYCYPYELNSMFRDNANIVFNYIADLFKTSEGITTKILDKATKVFDLKFERLEVEEGSFMKILINILDYDKNNFQIMTYADSSFYGDASEIKFCDFLETYYNK